MKRAVIVVAGVLAACSPTHDSMPSPIRLALPPLTTAAMSKRPIPIPAECDGVIFDVVPLPEDAAFVVVPSTVELPLPVEQQAFIDAVPGLAAAMVDHDTLDRDMFYVRAHHLALDRLVRHYPEIDPGVVREAKLYACETTGVYVEPLQVRATIPISTRSTRSP